MIKIKSREHFFRSVYLNDNLYSMYYIVEDHKDFNSDEYYMKIKCIAMNSLDT